MRFSASVALVLAFSLGPAVAAPDEKEFEQMLRAASRMEAIARVCPPLIPTDASQAHKYSLAYIKTLERFASERLKEAMPAEVMRRISEVEITGEQRWCEDQRRFMHEVGAGEVFPIARGRSKR